MVDDIRCHYKTVATLRYFVASVTLRCFVTLRCADWSEVHDVGEVEIDGLEELVFVEWIVITVVGRVSFFPVQHLQQKAVISLG